MTQSRNETANFRLVAQCLNQAHANTFKLFIFNFKNTSSFTSLIFCHFFHSLRQNPVICHIVGRTFLLSACTSSCTVLFTSVSLPFPPRDYLICVCQDFAAALKTADSARNSPGKTKISLGSLLTLLQAT
jgi:hypothetical protein